VASFPAQVANVYGPPSLPYCSYLLKRAPGGTRGPVHHLQRYSIIASFEIAMGFYSTHIFPRLLDWSLGNDMIQRQRREALAPLHGRVLEIGFGTGLNLPFFPARVTRLTVIDNERMLPKRVAKRIAEVQLPIEQFTLDAGGKLPFDEESFDGVLTTFTLCSISNIASALAEIRRVLNVSGEYVFLEHGRSDDPRVANRQDFFNPLQKLIACGCNMNRSIDVLIEAAGLEIIRLDRYSLPDTPRILGAMYRGIAKRASGAMREP
jgi:ubiquinone/menaquinone biosynthesis C-methylase UbiE